jgi:hypothetical protein
MNQIMNHSARVLYHMVKADFLERVRRYSFLVILAGALYLAYGVAAEKVWVLVGDGYRGVYNSAWIGMLMAICCSTFLSLCGFYVVKNSVERDSTTRVGRILAATPLRKEFYTIAKTISNFAVLACMVLVLMAAAVVMQWLRPEVRPISLWKLWLPFLLIALPAMFITGSLALLFETLPVLRGGVGNVIYFFVWTFAIVAGVQSGFDDPAGIRILEISTRQAMERMNPGASKNSAFSLTIGGEHATRTFLWNGVDWTLHGIMWRLTWAAVGLGVALLASIFFHRFDPARESIREDKGKEKRSATVGDPALVHEFRQLRPEHATLTLTPLGQRGHNRFARLVLSELRLMVKGLRWWWYAVATGLLVAEFVSPTREAREGVLLAAWIWPVLVWSQMGCRESRHATQSLIFSAERVAYRQLSALWTAGVAVAIVTGAGTGIRLLIGADWQMLAAWLAGALFIPSLALALGVWSGSSKFFEALYTVWWYVGPLHRTPSLDFVGGSRVSSAPALYLSLAAGLLLASCLGRRRQVAYA